MTKIDAEYVKAIKASAKYAKERNREMFLFLYGGACGLAGFASARTAQKIMGEITCCAAYYSEIMDEMRAERLAVEAC